jgi:hypothetical protein
MPDMLRCAVFAAGLCAVPSFAGAADAPSTPDQLIAACASEAGERAESAGRGSHYTVTHSETSRFKGYDLVRIDLTSGEGRLLHATCKFRDGKLFDIAD